MASVTLAFTILSCLMTLFVKGDSLNGILFDGSYEFVDLTHPFDNHTIYWPGTRPFKFTKITEEYRSTDKSWYATNEFEAGEHGGTHIDAPYHFSMTGKRVGDLPMDKLIVPLIVADISSKVNDNPDFVLHKHDLDFMINDCSGKPCVLIFKFGWSKYFNDRRKYLGFDEQTNTLRFPDMLYKDGKFKKFETCTLQGHCKINKLLLYELGLSAEVAEWIASSYKNIVGIGVDVASIDPGSSSDFAAHKILSRAGLYNIENVNFEKPIHEYKCTALVLPMKIQSGTGAPLRLVAICPKEIPTQFK